MLSICQLIEGNRKLKDTRRTWVEGLFGDLFKTEGAVSGAGRQRWLSSFSMYLKSSEWAMVVYNSSPSVEAGRSLWVPEHGLHRESARPLRTT